MTHPRAMAGLPDLLYESFARIPDPVIWATAAVLAVAAAFVGWRLLRRAARITSRAVGALARLVSIWCRARTAEDILTIVAASIATGVSAQGMWNFSGDVLGFDGPLRVLLFAFIEVAIITSAVRAQRSMREKYSAGIDGIAVWALASLTAVLSSLDSGSIAEAIFRLAAPLVAAWLWERGMAIERHRITGRSRIHWRLTPERVMVRLGLAEATDKTAGEVDAQRRRTRVALAAKKARDLRDAAAPARKQRQATDAMQRAYATLHAHTGIGHDGAEQQALAAEVASLYSAASLLDVAPASAWTSEPTEEPFTRLADETEQLNKVLAARHDSRDAIANLAMLAAAATGNHLVPVTPSVTADVTGFVTTKEATNPVTDEVTEEPAAAPDPAPEGGLGVTSSVTKIVTPSVVTDQVTDEVTFDVTNPDMFDLEKAFALPSNVTPLVTPSVTTNEVTNEVTDEVTDEVTNKTDAMRAHWTQALAEDPPQYPTVTELADAAGAHHTLASRLRKQWVAELPWTQRRKASHKRTSA